MKQEQLANLPIEWKRGSGLRKSDLELDGKNKCILYGELYTKHKNVLINSNNISKTNKIGTICSKEGDILIPGTSTASKKDMLLAREIDEEGVFLGGDINIIRPTKGLFAKKYLPYFFETSSAYDQLDKYITGATGIIHISNSGLKNLKIPLPPLKEQKRIVSILDKCFSAIAIAKANAEQCLSLSKALFENYLQEIFEKKGEGWKEKKVLEIGKVQTGTTPKTAEIENYGNFIPFVKPADVDFSGIGDIRYDNEGLSEIGLKKGRKLESDSILMVCIGATIGKVGFSECEVSCNQQINSLTVKKEFEPKFIYYAMTSKEFQEKVLLEGKGAQATLPIINKSKWENLTISFPKNRSVQQRIVKKLDALRAETQKLEDIYQQKIEELEDLKKSILQKAFNGEL